LARCSIHEDVFSVAEPVKKKQKVELHPEETANAHIEDRGRTRLSMRLRERKESVGLAAPEKKTSRKRGRPSEVLLKDPGKLKVAQLRSELKKRGLRTSGLKAVLFDRLLDALEVEQQEDQHLKKVQEVDEEQGGDEHKPPQEVIVIDDDGDEDEIVRESVGSNKSQGRSQSTSPKAATAEDEAKDAEGSEEKPEILHRKSPPSTSKGAVSQTEEAPTTGQDTAETAPETDSASPTHQYLSSKTTTARTSHESVRFGLGAGGAEELINHDVLKLTRKSMQASGKSELWSPLAWKRKSILRKASSLAPSSRDLSRKVSFAARDKVDVIVESSQTDSSQPDPSPTNGPASTYSEIPREGGKPAGTDDDDAADEKPKAPSTVVATSADSSSPDDAPAQVMPVVETEEQRKKREFDESVQREAEKLRRALKLSAQKRLEEAKASKAFWAKRDQLKAKLRASSAGDKQKSAHTRVASSEKSDSERHSPATSEPSPPAANVPSASDPSRLTSSAPKEKSAQAARVEAAEEDRDLEFLRSMARHHEVEDISNVSSAFESSSHELKAPRATYSAVEEKRRLEHSEIERSGKPAAKSMPASMTLPKEPTANRTARLDEEELAAEELHRPAYEPPVLSTAPASLTGGNDTSKLNPSGAEASAARDSLSSTVSSIPDPSVVENALKTGASSGARGVQRPLTNLVSGLHSFTTLLEKSSSQESSSGRGVPVVNALKLAERSRVQEEKKKLEKEKRKAILKKKMEEHKKLAALKEKAVKDAQAKREQERLNERKKREAELARKRQQRLKEMRAGLEKKRAMIAAEKTSSAALASKAAASTASHHKHRGLASASEASQPTAKPMAKPVSKPTSKPTPKPAPASKPAPGAVSTAVPELVLTSPDPAKFAPKSHSPEIVNYEMSDNAQSSGGESSESDSERPGKKKVPRWAQKDHLNKILRAQFVKNAIDPSPAIFQDFVDTCNLEAIFEPTDVRKKKKFARRTSSGNWLADRPTARDRALYRRDMGFDQ